MQRSLTLLGDVAQSLHKHSAKEMALCTSMAQAVYLAILRAKLTQEQAAEAIGVTAGYLSMLLSGKRRWNDEQIRKLVLATHSLAPIQFLCAQFGGTYEEDLDAQEEAILERRLEQVRTRRAA